MKRNRGEAYRSNKRTNSLSNDIRVAKELCYPVCVIQLLKEASDSSEKRQKILSNARKGVYDEQ